jgi:glycosyltransferase involved in cell wall biosynthesis
MASKHTPFFSIITCTYNIGKHLQKNIDSVQKQQFRSFEHIFIDGFSKDKTVSIIKKYQKKHPDQVRLYQAQPKGIWNAINKGNTLAKGKYILHLEGDNSLHDQKVLKNVFNFLNEHPDDDWIYSKINTVKSNYRSIGTFPNQRLLQLGWGYLLKYFNFIPQEAMFVKRQVFRQFGTFDESLRTGSDYDYWLRIADKTKWSFFNRVVTNYLIRSDAISSDPKIRQENVENCLKIQKKHLSSVEYVVAKAINLLVEHRNKVYKNVT